MPKAQIELFGMPFELPFGPEFISSIDAGEWRANSDIYAMQIVSNNGATGFLVGQNPSDGNGLITVGESAVRAGKIRRFAPPRLVLQGQGLPTQSSATSPEVTLFQHIIQIEDDPAYRRQVEKGIEPLCDDMEGDKD